MKPILLILAALALLPWRGWAQSSEMSLEECIRYALQHNPKVKGVHAEADIAAANYGEAIGKLLPSITASGAAYINFGRGIDPKTNTYTDINSFRNNYNIEGSWLLFDGFSSLFRLRMTRYEKITGREQARLTADLVRMETIEAYYRLLYAHELCRTAESDLAGSQAMTRRIQRMYELGSKGAPDVAEMRATEATDRLTLVRRRNEYEIAVLKLKEKMNYPIGDTLSIRDSLTLSIAEATDLKADELYDLALRRLPKSLVADGRVKSAEQAYRAAVGSFLPRLSLFAGFGTSYSFFMDGSAHESFATQLRNRRGEYVGITLSFDLFDGLRKTSALKRSKASLRLAESQREETHREVYRDIQQSILEVNAAVEEYRASVEKVEHLDKAYRTLLRNYEAGNAGSIDVSTAAARLKGARTEMTYAYTTYLLKREWLAYYTYID